MLRHIILWNLREEFSPEERKQRALEIKRELENLKNLIDEIISIRVEIHPLPSGNADLMLDSTFADAQALERYRVHPEHQRVGREFVRPSTCNRMCIDYLVEAEQ